MQLMTAPPDFTASVFDSISTYLRGGIGLVGVLIIGTLGFFWVAGMLIDKIKEVISLRNDPTFPARADLSQRREIIRERELTSRFQNVISGDDRIDVDD